MQLKLKTILNSKEKYSHFIYQDICLNETRDEPKSEIKVVPCQGSKKVCSGYNKTCTGYHRLKEREFIHVPQWDNCCFAILYTAFAMYTLLEPLYPLF